MEGYRCPGQSHRNIKAELHQCPACGYHVEIFSDELMVRCPGCNREVYAKKNPSCIDWCKAAEKCLGQDRYKELKRGTSA